MKTALITGATSGIGEEFARVLASKGYRLIITGRRVERLEKLAGELDVPCRIIAADLSEESECHRLLKETADEKISVFINNAGFGAAGGFLATDIDKELSMIHVNDIAMHILFKGVLKKMAERDQGYILNVASSAGLLPGGPYMATYYATKAYVVSLTRAVATELREMGSRVHVSALCPGPVDTEFNERADVVFALKGISAQKCVSEAIKGMNKRSVIIVPTFAMKAATFMQKFAPMDMLLGMVGSQQKKKIQ